MYIHLKSWNLCNSFCLNRSKRKIQCKNISSCTRRKKSLELFSLFFWRNVWAPKIENWVIKKILIVFLPKICQEDYCDMYTQIWQYKRIAPPSWNYPALRNWGRNQDWINLWLWLKQSDKEGKGFQGNIHISMMNIVDKGFEEEQTGASIKLFLFDLLD